MAKGTLRVVIAGDTGPLKKTLGGAGGMIGKFAAGIGAAVAGAAAFSVKSFADFDKAMTSSLAIMGDVSDAMRKDMSDAAREVAKTTRFSAVEAAESYFFLASAGMDAEQAIGALPRVAAFAQAGNFDMARATDLATDAQSALGLTSEDTAKNLEGLNRTTDVFVKANTLANASVEEFATSMTQKAGSALRSVGKDIEEGTAVLAVFADQGIKGERAGTILRATLDGLTDGARKNADAFDKLGVAVFDGEGDMRNMADIVEDLEVGLEGMSTEQKLAELNQLGFNRRTSEGILALLGNSEALADYEEQLREAGGTTDEVADKQLQNFWDQLGLLKDQFVDIGLSIGEALMPHLENLVGWLQENMPAIEQIIDDTLEGIEQFWDDHGATIMNAAEVAWDTIADTVETTMLIIESSIEIGSTIISGNWSEFWNDMNSTNSSGSAKLKDKIIGSFNDINTESGILWNEIWQELVLIWGRIVSDTDAAVIDVKDNVVSGWEALKRDTGIAWSDMVEIIMAKGGEILDWVARLPGRIVDFFAGLPGDMRNVGAGAMSFLQRGLDLRWSDVSSFLAGLPGRIAGFFVGLPGQMAGIGASIVRGLQSGFSAQWNRFVGWVSSLPGAGIVRNIAGQLGIGSPSRVMAEEIGGPAVEGIEVGMRDRFGDLERAAAEIPELMRAAEVDARRSLMAAAAADTPPVAASGGAGEPAEVVVRLEVGAGGDSEVGALVGALVRKGVIRLSANGTRVRVGG